MSSRTGNWMIALGAVAALIGLVIAASSVGDHEGTTLLAVGMCVISMGLLLAATGVFLKARLLQASGGAAESKSSSKRGRGGCDLCGDAAVVHCKVHQVHLCAECLGKHYDLRSCAYVPSSRRQAAKASAEKSMAANARS